MGCKLQERLGVVLPENWLYFKYPLTEDGRWMDRGTIVASMRKAGAVRDGIPKGGNALGIKGLTHMGSFSKYLYDNWTGINRVEAMDRLLKRKIELDRL